MLLRLLIQSARNRPKPVLLMLVSIVLGTMTATALVGVYRDIGSRLAHELRSYGANIVVEPLAGEGSYLAEDDLVKIKTVFWKSNIIGFTPYLFGIAEISAGEKHDRAVVAGTWFKRTLEVPGEEPTTQGITVVSPWWEVSGKWPAAADHCIIGAALARRLAVTPGNTVHVTAGGSKREILIVGTVTTGGYEEEQLFIPLETAQAFFQMPGKVSRVLLSALTVPLDDFGRQDPAAMDRKQYERWYCTAYVTAIAKNVEEVMADSRARPIWQVAAAEGALLEKLDWLMLLLSMIAMAAAATGVATALIVATRERSREIGLMKAMGADRRQIMLVLLSETAVLSLCGGIIGFFAGNRLATFISREVFAVDLSSPAWLLPLALFSAFAVAGIGSFLPLRAALAIEPVRALKG